MIQRLSGTSTGTTFNDTLSIVNQPTIRKTSYLNFAAPGSITTTAVSGGETITHNGGASLTAVAGQITVGAGTVSQIKINGVLYFPCEEGNGSTAYDVVPGSGADGFISGGAWAAGDFPSYNLEKGYYQNGVTLIPALSDGTLAADGSALTAAGGITHNGCEVSGLQNHTKIVDAIDVVGCATTAFNGTYNWVGESGGKALYQLDATHYLNFSDYGNGSRWTIVDDQGNPEDEAPLTATGAFPPQAGWGQEAVEVLFSSFYENSENLREFTFDNWVTHNNELNGAHNLWIKLDGSGNVIAADQYGLDQGLLPAEVEQNEQYYGGTSGALRDQGGDLVVDGEGFVVFANGDPNIPSMAFLGSTVTSDSAATSRFALHEGRMVTSYLNSPRTSWWDFDPSSGYSTTKLTNPVAQNANFFGIFITADTDKVAYMGHLGTDTRVSAYSQTGGTLSNISELTPSGAPSYTGSGGDGVRSTGYFVQHTPNNGFFFRLFHFNGTTITQKNTVYPAASTGTHAVHANQTTGRFAAIGYTTTTRMMYLYEVQTDALTLLDTYDISSVGYRISWGGEAGAEEGLVFADDSTIKKVRYDTGNEALELDYTFNTNAFDSQVVRDAHYIGNNYWLLLQGGEGANLGKLWWFHDKGDSAELVEAPKSDAAEAYQLFRSWPHTYGARQFISFIARSDDSIKTYEVTL
jgi:hypothetical protein